MEDVDILVAGAGPAGLALAAACAAHGLTTVCADPAADRPWTNNYGAWAADLPARLPGTLVDRTWPSAALVLADGSEIVLRHAYVRLSNTGLRSALLEAGGSKVDLRAIGVVRVRHDSATTTATLADGSRLRARLAVDATGAARRLLGPPARHRPGPAQVAHGITATVDGHPWPADQMLLMDLRSPYPGAPAPPTFLYAMPFDAHRVFVEETSLMSAPPVTDEYTEQRLYRRLAELGVRVTDVEAVERCAIPMDVPIPDRRNRTVAFGAAAGYVHPATGYSVAASLRQAPDVADAIAAVARAGPRGSDLAAAAWAAVWPARARRMRRFHSLGGALLQRLDTDGVSRFMRWFFSRPEPFWHGYLAGDGLAELATAFFATQGSPDG